MKFTYRKKENLKNIFYELENKILISIFIKINKMKGDNFNTIEFYNRVAYLNFFE